MYIFIYIDKIKFFEIYFVKMLITIIFFLINNKKRQEST